MPDFIDTFHLLLAIDTKSSGMWGLFKQTLSPRVCRKSTVIILQGSWLRFLNTVPLHTQCICFPFRRQAFLMILSFPLREMYYPHMTGIFWSTNFQRDADLFSTISKKVTPNIFLLQLKKKKRRWWESYKTMMKRASLRKKSRKTFGRSLREVAQKLIPKYCTKYPSMSSECFGFFLLDAGVLFF